eukprot:10705547-Prorocentrum_lima.AAC.1
MDEDDGDKENNDTERQRPPATPQQTRQTQRQQSRSVAGKPKHRDDTPQRRKTDATPRKGGGRTEHLTEQCRTI